MKMSRCLIVLVGTLMLEGLFGTERSEGDETPTCCASGNYSGPLEIAAISRFRNLPMRMELEPRLLPPAVRRTTDPRHLPLFNRVLKESQDGELLEVAALSLARFARENLGDMTSSLELLRKHLRESDSVPLRHACAMALVAADDQPCASELLRLSVRADDSFRLTAEPALARWKVMEAAEMWHARLSDSLATQTSVRLACEGLVALDHQAAVPALTQLLDDQSASWGKRLAAATAIGQLQPTHGRSVAARHRTGDVQDRLLAVSLLSNADPTCLTDLTLLCADPAQGVASAAWRAVYRLDTGRLITHLPQGRRHDDAVIRRTAALVMQQFPDAERCEWLHELSGDIHLEVRNVARVALVAVAGVQAERKPEIIQRAAARIAGDPLHWQGIEQSLLLLGQLAATQFSESCLPLLDHPRPEVHVTAAWLMHLYPDETVMDRVLEHVLRSDEWMERPPEDREFNYETQGLQMACLFQLAALQGRKSLQPVLEKNLIKGASGGLPKRCAALWALGLLYQNDPDPALVRKLEARIRDRDGIPPEEDPVRKMAVVALGMMRSNASSELLKNALEVDPPFALIPEAARWALPLLGQERPPEIPVQIHLVGGWKLNPVGPLR